MATGRRPRGLSRLALLALLVIALLAGASFFLLSREAPQAAAAGEAPAADAGQVRYVLTPDLFVREAPDPRAKAVARLQVGAELRVSSEPVSGPSSDFWRVVLAGKGRGGYLPDAELSETKPNAAEALAAARESLARGDLDEAVKEATRAASLDPSLREAWDLLAAIHDARRDVEAAREVYRRRAGLPALPAPAAEEVSHAPPQAGDARFVAATKLRVRDAPSLKGKILTELPLNTRVEVLDVSGTFARVRWTTAEHAVWLVPLGHDGAPRRLDSSGQPQEGYAAAAFLAPDPWTVEGLLAEAGSAEQQARSLDAARALERAAVLDPRPESLRRLVAAAAGAGLFKLAANTAVKLAQAPAPLSSGASLPDAGTKVSVPLELTLYFGCNQEPPFDPAAACIAGASYVGACAPCSPVDESMFLGDDATADERERLRAEHEAALEAHLVELEAHQQGLAALAKDEEALRGRYPSGPWLHAVLTGDDALAGAGMQVVVYSLDFNLGGYCGNYEAWVSGALVAGGHIPWPAGGQTLELWVKGTGYAHALYGVVPAASAAEVGALFQEGGPYQTGSRYDGDPTAYGPKPNVAGPYKACIHCCGC